MNLIHFLQHKIVSQKDIEFEKLVKKYRNFVFLSPHLDDAILSCGLLITKLRDLNKDYTIITVFTKCADSLPSPQAISFTKGCGYSSGNKLFTDMRRENKNVMKRVGARYYHLGFIDAAWRTNCLNHPIYKNGKNQFSGKLSPLDDNVKNQIRDSISKLLPKGNFVILAPLGIGGHADHVLVNRIAMNLVNDVIFWEDFPYNTSRENTGNFSIKAKKYSDLFTLQTNDYSEKRQLIDIYKSQTGSIFPNHKIPSFPEKYFMLKI